MFCKICGQQNPDDAKFCMSCGAAMSVVKEEMTPKVENKVASVETIKSKPNAFQKILFLVSFTWFIVAIFYIPYNNDGGIDYDVLWADRSEKVNLLRVLLQFGLLFIATFLLYLYLRRYSNLERLQYKKLAKRELILFFIFVFSIIACVLYLFGGNFISKKRDQKLAEQIAPIEQKIQDNSRKKTTRAAFVKIVNRVIDLESNYDNKINRYWDFLMINKENIRWLESYYALLTIELEYNNPLGHLQNEPFNEKVSKTKVLKGKVYFKENGNWYDFGYLRKSYHLVQFSFNSPADFKLFIENNNLTAEDLKKEKENVKLNENVKKLHEKKSQITIYNNEDFRRISFTTLIIVFTLLYILRPLLWFVNGLFTEIK
jgi:hypothetical protein